VGENTFVAGIITKTKFSNFMKRITIPFLALFLLAASTTVQAQVDLKINPIGLLFSNLNVAAEFGVSENFGVELAPGFAWNSLNLANDDDFKGSLVRVGVNGRYYLNPNEKGLNGFYIGAYTRYAGGSYKFEDDTETQKFNSTRFAWAFCWAAKSLHAMKNCSSISVPVSVAHSCTNSPIRMALMKWTCPIFLL